jgi:hypothetical protein
MPAEKKPWARGRAGFRPAAGRRERGNSSGGRGEAFLLRRLGRWLGWPLLGLALAGCGPSAEKPATESAASPPSTTATPETATSAPPARPWYEDVTEQCGVKFHHQLADGDLSNIMESDGAGGVVLDYDGDGWLDLYLVNSGPAPVLSDAPPDTKRWPNRLFHNRGDGTFEDVTETAGVAGHGFGTTGAAADYDNDGDTDLLVVNFGGLILYRNEGNGRFQDVTEAAGLKNDHAGISATFFDADRDGFLDLFVANYLVFDPTIKVPENSPQPYPGPLAYGFEFNVLFHNRGDGTFEDVSEASGIRIAGHRAMSATAFDYDLDGDDDLYVSNDGTPNLLLKNDGKGHFEDVAMESGVAFNGFGKADGSMAASVGDCNGDTWPDMFVTRFGNASLYLNSPNAFFEDHIEASGILRVSAKFTGWGGNFLDLDNDGDLDLFVANGNPHFMTGMPPLLLENDGQAHFVNLSAAGGEFFTRQVNARGSGTWDYDNDGGMDLIICALGGPAAVLHHRAPPAGRHYLRVRLEGTRSNRDGIGARVRVEAGGRVWLAERRCPTSYLFQSEPRLHFGLGACEQVDQITVQWPSGAEQTLKAVPVDQELLIREPAS